MQHDRERGVDGVPGPAGPLTRADDGAGDGREEGAAPGRKESVYSGPERRAQGYLVAEIIAEAPRVDGQTLEFDRTS